MPTLLSWGCWNRLLATTTTTTEKKYKTHTQNHQKRKERKYFSYSLFFFPISMCISFSIIKKNLRIWMLFYVCGFFFLPPMPKKPTPKNPLKRS
jgi:hypothetical protein